MLFKLLFNTLVTASGHISVILNIKQYKFNILIVSLTIASSEIQLFQKKLSQKFNEYGQSYQNNQRLFSTNIFYQQMQKMARDNRKISSEECFQIQPNASSGFLKSQGSSDCIGTFDDAPSYMLENQYIRSGYRLKHYKPRRIFKSLFKMHNQTLNIWTHLIGFTIILFILFQISSSKMEQSHIIGKRMVTELFKESHRSHLAQCSKKSNPFKEYVKENGSKNHICSNRRKRTKSQTKCQQIPTWPLTLNLVGGAICMACSVTYHLLTSFSKNVHKISRNLDYAGIGLYFSLSTIPAIYYKFFCNELLKIVYITLNLSTGLSFSYFVIIKGTSRIQLITVVLFALTQLILSVHFSSNQIIENQKNDFSFLTSFYIYLGAQISCVIGGFSYFYRCPERYYPGKFDIWGHSHQIWHIFSFLGMVFNYLGGLSSYEVRSLWIACYGPCKF